MTRLAPFLSAASLFACARLGQPSAEVGCDGSYDCVQLIVVNQTMETVMLSLWWDNAGSSVRLAELRGGHRVSSSTPRRGARLWLRVEAVSVPPVGTTSAPLAFSGTADRRERRPVEFVDVAPGDRWEWVIKRTTPAVELFYQRLDPL